MFIYFSFPGRKGSKVRDFYRGKEMALWLKLVPKLNHPDVNSSDASHELDNAENMSTFDDPTRLISKFHSIFPSPPPPPYTPPFTPPQSDPAYVTTEDDVDDHTRESVDITDKPKPDGLSNHRVTPTAAGPVVRKSDGGKRDDSSNNVPLSIVIAVGAGLLFLNILISAVTYFQRKRIAKLREANVQNMNHINPGDIQDNRNSNPYRGRGGTPESVNLMNTSETKQPPKVAAINHKTVSDTPPVYSAISKPVVPPQGPGVILIVHYLKNPHRLCILKIKRLHLQTLTRQKGLHLKVVEAKPHLEAVIIYLDLLPTV